MAEWTARFRGPLDAALLRCLAILLVTNSHLDGLYPIPQLATGGALGNALFFTASGYGLALRYASTEWSFPVWYWQRLLRLYPSVLIVMAVFELGVPGGWTRWTLGDYFEVFLWPTPAWFISALLIFYAGVYPFIRLNNLTAYSCGLAVVGALYGTFYFVQVDLGRYSIEGDTRFKWIFYFGLMLLGGLLATRERQLSAPQTRRLWVAVGLLCCYFGLGYLLSRGHFTRYQFLIHVITVPLVISVFALSKADWLKRNVSRSRLAMNSAYFLSGVTLEIYLLQFYVYSNPAVGRLPFPGNVLAFWLALLLLAWLVAAGASRLRALVRRQPDPTGIKDSDAR